MTESAESRLSQTQEARKRSWWAVLEVVHDYWQLPEAERPGSSLVGRPFRRSLIERWVRQNYSSLLLSVLLGILAKWVVEELIKWIIRLIIDRLTGQRKYAAYYHDRQHIPEEFLATI